MRADPCVLTWDDRIGAVGGNSPINAVLKFPSIDGLVVVAGGRFTQIGGRAASRVAVWNGVRWNSLGAGVSGVGAAVHSLEAFDDGTGLNLFVGGEFTAAGGMPASRIARWNGTTWSSIGGGANGTVFSLKTLDDGQSQSLFVGGAFDAVGATPAEHLVRWDGEEWSPVGGGLDGNVQAMAVVNEDGKAILYVGGEFARAGDVAASNIARWDGAEWSALDDGLNGPVFALAVFDAGTGPRLYAGGSFSNAAGANAASLAVWDGFQWNAVNGGTDATVRALAVFDEGFGDALYVAGTFQHAGGIPASRIARFNGSAWSALAQGANNAVFALAPVEEPGVIGPGLYAGGSFTTAGIQTSNFVARWVDCGPAPGDMNDDGAIDPDDVDPMTTCLAGPFQVVIPICARGDSDADGDLDLRDFALFQRLFAVDP